MGGGGGGHSGINWWGCGTQKRGGGGLMCRHRPKNMRAQPESLCGGGGGIYIGEKIWPPATRGVTLEPTIDNDVASACSRF